MRPLEPQDPKEIGGVSLYSRLGSGGFGTVYLGWSRLEDWVAVKVLSLGTIDRESRERFAREARTTRLVDSEFVASIQELSLSGNPPYIVSEYVPGPTLVESLRDFRALSLPEVEALAVGLAQALADLSTRNIIHRDVKPSNIILGESGPVLVDLGIARTDADTMITRDGGVAGTPQWMAPEQARGSSVTPATDVWAWGRCLQWLSDKHSISFTEDSELMRLVLESQREDPESRPTAAAIVSVLSPNESSTEYVAARWGDIKSFALDMRSTLPASGQLPTQVEQSVYPTKITETTRYQNFDPDDDQEVPDQPPVVVRRGKRSVAAWILVPVGALFFLAVLAVTVAFGAQWFSSTGGSQQESRMDPTIVIVTPMPAPNPTVTVTEVPEASPQINTVPPPAPTVDPYLPQGGEQAVINELAFGMNAQDWIYVDSLCNPPQTCQVQFTDFFAKRYASGQWVETSFGTFNFCRYNVPFGMERGCTNSNRWVGEIYFTCYKNGRYGFQSELTSFTFNYSSGYPSIERFDPVVVMQRADECY